MNHLIETILESLFNAITNDVKSGNSKFSKEELISTLDILSRTTQKMSDIVNTEHYDRLSLMNTYHISKREFYRLRKEGLLKPQTMPNSTKLMYSKLNMDILVEKGLVRRLKDNNIQ